MNKYELYLFDFDGTLVDSLESLIDVFAKSFEAIDVKIDTNNVLRYTRIPIEETYMEVGAPMDRVKEFEKAIRYYLDDLEVLKKTKLFSDTRKVLDELYRRGDKLGIVTSNNEKHVKDVLNLFDIPLEYFSIYVDSDKVRETKPSPKPLLYALEELGYMDKKDVVAYIGDGINDMISASKAGISRILIDRTNAFGDGDYIKISSLSELL